jgi:hypothetical protein
MTQATMTRMMKVSSTRLDAESEFEFEFGSELSNLKSELRFERIELRKHKTRFTNVERVFL